MPIKLVHDGYDVALATRVDIADIQDLQERVFQQLSQAQKSLIYPRDAAFREKIVDEGGDLFVVRDETGKAIGSMISANLNKHEEYEGNLAVDLLAGGDYLVAGSKRRVLSTGLVDMNYLGHGIWQRMVDTAVMNASLKGFSEVMLGAFLHNDIIINKARNAGFVATALVKHKVMGETGFLFSINKSIKDYIVSDVQNLSYENPADLMVQLETMLDQGYVGVSFDTKSHTVCMARQQAVTYTDYLRRSF